MNFYGQNNLSKKNQRDNRVDKVNKNKIKKKEIRLQVHGENKKKNRSIVQ